MAVTRLGAYGGPRPPYGSFAGKAAAGGHPVAYITRLGMHGGPRPRYGSFAGKTSGAPGHPVAHITRLGMYGGPRPLYGDFTGKTGTVAAVPGRRRRGIFRRLGAYN